jgi:HSP20 family protein
MDTKAITIVSQDYDEVRHSLEVEVPLPGAGKDTIDLQVHHDGFTLRATRSDGEEVEYIGAFSLCCPVDQERVSASYEDGLLHVSFPVHESVDRPRRVEIA